MYASTLGLNAAGSHDYAGDEPHYLLTTLSVVRQFGLDLSDEYRTRSWHEFDTAPIRPQGRELKTGLYEPHWIGLPLIAAPLYAIGGAKAVELLIAALLALAGAWSYLLARRVVPDPWCAGAALAVGLSPPLVAHGTAVLPDPVGAALLTGAALCAARLRDQTSRRTAFACFALLGLLPWMGLKFLPAGIVIAVDAIRSLRRVHRSWLALASAEIASFSIALLVGLNESIFGGPTPHAADFAGTSATGASTAADYLGRCWRIVALFLDQRYGLVRWAPVAALIFAGVWVLYRAARERLVQAIAGLGDELGVARLCGAAALAGLVTVALFVPDIRAGGFPARELVAYIPLSVPLVALGLRLVPRIGALLSLIGIAGSVWLWVAVRSGGALITDRPRAPWGVLTEVFPRFSGGIWPYVLMAAIALAAAAPFVREEIAIRRRLS